MIKRSVPKLTSVVWTLSVVISVVLGGQALGAMQRGQRAAIPDNGSGVTVSGRVVTAPGTPLPESVDVTMSSPRAGVLNSRMQPDGTFVFLNVKPGRYLLVLVVKAPQFEAQSQITVESDDVTGVELVDSSWVRNSRGLQQVWSLNGEYAGVVWDPSAGVLHAINGTTLVDIDPAGHIVKQLPIELGKSRAFANLRLAHFKGVGTVLLAFGTWSSAVNAYDLTGKELWSYGNNMSGIDDVWPAQLDGSGSDDVIVGFNGSTGLHVLDSNGHLMWKDATIGNVWHVASAGLDGTGKLQPISTSAAGSIHIFNQDGNGRRDQRAGLYATMIRAGKISKDDKADTIFVLGGSGTELPTAAALSVDGVRKWMIQLPGSKQVYSTYLAATRPWLAVGRQGGEVDVIDASQFAIICAIDGQGFDPETAWIESTDANAPLLAITTRTRLAAFKVEEKGGR